ncbi:unnamed protein product, partial [Laminaria digitata]
MYSATGHSTDRPAATVLGYVLAEAQRLRAITASRPDYGLPTTAFSCNLLTSVIAPRIERRTNTKYYPYVHRPRHAVCSGYVLRTGTILRVYSYCNGTQCYGTLTSQGCAMYQPATDDFVADQRFGRLLVTAAVAKCLHINTHPTMKVQCDSCATSTTFEGD